MGIGGLAKIIHFAHFAIFYTVALSFPLQHGIVCFSIGDTFCFTAFQMLLGNI